MAENQRQDAKRTEPDAEPPPGDRQTLPIVPGRTTEKATSCPEGIQQGSSASRETSLFPMGIAIKDTTQRRGSEKIM